MEQENIPVYEEKRKDEKGVEEWRAGILAGSVMSVPFEYGIEGRGASKRKSSIIDGLGLTE
jgi:hypothetical protein